MKPLKPELIIVFADLLNVLIITTAIVIFIVLLSVVAHYNEGSEHLKNILFMTGIGIIATTFGFIMWVKSIKTRAEPLHEAIKLKEKELEKLLIAKQRDESRNATTF